MVRFLTEIVRCSDRSDICDCRRDVRFQFDPRGLVLDQQSAEQFFVLRRQTVAPNLRSHAIGFSKGRRIVISSYPVPFDTARQKKELFCLHVEFTSRSLIKFGFSIRSAIF
jgi:hypothetical protein